MGVTVDDVRLEVDRLGLSTVGEVLSHVARGNRLVVQLLLDGNEPDLREMDAVRRRSLSGCSVFIETAEPLEIAREVLRGVETSVEEVERLRLESAELFRAGDAARAMQSLAGCFAAWGNARESVEKVAKLLRLDLTAVSAGETTAEQILSQFAGQLRQLKEALEARDHVLCCDVLTYEMENTREDWRTLVSALLDCACVA
jgi:predicted DNA-binding protein (UPF0251 family)